MQKMLERLYYEGFKDDAYPQMSTYKEAAREAERAQARLTGSFSPEQKEYFEQYCAARGEEISCSCCQWFIEGFRLGAGLMIDTLYPEK